MCLDDWNFSGFKLHFSVQLFSPDDPRFTPVYKAVQERQRAVIMHISSFPWESRHLGANCLHRILQAFPRLKVLVAHLGSIDTDNFWRLMDKYPSIYLDTAFLLGNPMYPNAYKIVAATLQRFPDRVLYGSDFPFICHDINDGLNYIYNLPWDEKIKKKLLYLNAEEFLKQ